MDKRETYLVPSIGKKKKIPEEEEIQGRMEAKV